MPWRRHSCLPRPPSWGRSWFETVPRSGKSVDTISGTTGRSACATRYNWSGESPLENKEIARVLWETADLMEIAAEDGFRIRSYRNGATAVEGYPERIVDILGDPARKVTDIPGIGKGLAVVLAEIAERGSDR